MSRAMKKVDPPLKMEIVANSVRNTTIAVEDDRYYFEVVTRYWHPTTTKINRFDVETRLLTTVAEIEGLRGADRRVRFLQPTEKGPQLGDWISASEFLKDGKFATDTGTEYLWKSHRRKLRLLKDGEDEKAPAVQYHSHKRYFWVLRMSRHAWLDVKPELTDSLEKVIVSYLLAERQKRDKWRPFS
ncbi:hypothetical protein PC9H_007047 [Pleurotus ostreatus]|uniref:DUF6593 domain-containing protein n=2 Tax=Pleurotus ostreatus TaxID=5322 RepID=A0A067NJR2_PLEO1|nr:uncharacterized protein PC9H_007047 [Pleurotus ostreatus]KAF7427831.1 hypothetical protein PC9H_007047 [Pleurotus ostreatus]KAJ8695825.1 hypothetical protein PTI98_005746 [Pleurotus ostreatus]KDQ27295.1 hypothetical protein PLEOSDRAFT_1112495 [Pleurotus ostreatus PC15]